MKVDDRGLLHPGASNVYAVSVWLWPNVLYWPVREWVDSSVEKIAAWSPESSFETAGWFNGLIHEAFGTGNREMGVIDLAIGIAAAAASFLLAWLLRGSRAQAAMAPITARLESVEQQHAQRLLELDVLKGAHARTIEQYHKALCQPTVRQEDRTLEEGRLRPDLVGAL